MTTNIYNEFERGFLKAAEENGCDVEFLRGYIKAADEIVSLWRDAFDEQARQTNEPHYHTKMAHEIVRYIDSYPELLKTAAGEDGYGGFLGSLGKQLPFLQQGQNWLSGGGLGETIGNAFKNNPNLLSSLAAGAGGGGLLGLLLGALSGHPMMGLMLGGLGGAGVSAYAGNKGIQDMFGGKSVPEHGLNPGGPTFDPSARPPEGPKPNAYFGDDATFRSFANSTQPNTNLENYAKNQNWNKAPSYDHSMLSKLAPPIGENKYDASLGTPNPPKPKPIDIGPYRMSKLPVTHF